MDILRKGNKDLIKDINRYTVLNLIREKGEITRTEIAKNCDFGMSTLTYILDDLQQEGIILEGAETSSTGGRRAKLVRFNKDYGFVVSVKVEEEQLLFALTDLNAEIMENTSIPFSSEKKPEEAIELIAKNVKKMCENRDMNHLLGVGIAISGLVNRRKGTVIRSTMLGWENVALEAMLHAYFPDIPVYVDKNINCYTLAELWLGEGKQSNNFATVSVGAGLGLSVVINRQIYYGAQGGAGEFGHTTIQPGGYKCHCGQKGCLEMYASEFYFRNRGEELKEAYPTSELKDFHFDKVAKSARAGDEMATELMGKMGEYLGYGIRNIINTFNPEKVIIVGEGLHHRDLFLTKIDEIASQNFFSGAGFETEITTTSLEDPAWLQGAALLVIHQLFQVPIYEEEQTLLR
ncbi:ROK family transcriptional regulator [Listeria monocytogenes]|uniref:ROK family transcriptional regulator n=1 Tax=Listeria monocytogenes TaxID=1639 RepID=UPI000CD9FF9D|nr:ROK family transcriptional regulator [Listeria monocytogenes]POQ55215.1 XylR family transcriptional regulator [Listeria monocytogenes]